MREFSLPTFDGASSERRNQIYYAVESNGVMVEAILGNPYQVEFRFCCNDDIALLVYIGDDIPMYLNLSPAKSWEVLTDKSFIELFYKNWEYHYYDGKRNIKANEPYCAKIELIVREYNKTLLEKESLETELPLVDKPTIKFKM